LPSPDSAATALPETERLELETTVIGLTCPRCHVPLHRGRLNRDWEIGGCRHCGGLVIPKADFQRVVRVCRAEYRGPDQTPRPLEPQELHEPCDCPGCLEPMETHPYYGPGNAVIDSCSGCGVTWLDRRELTNIICAPGQRDRLESAPRQSPWRLTDRRHR
jgi:Zn-finger nucleic acid-binding protein